MSMNYSAEIWFEHYPELLEILLQDKTTGQNIIRACDDYQEQGCSFDDEITPALLSTIEIKPRIFKDKKRQAARTKKNAEAFTPGLGVQYPKQRDRRSLVRPAGCVQLPPG